MALVFFLCVASLLSLFVSTKCDPVPDGVLNMECHERYFMIAVDLSFTGAVSYFEAVDVTGVYPITERYAAECGYSVQVLPLMGQVELRASYFSCHTDNTDDEIFSFSFNLIVMHEGNKAAYSLSKTCSLLLPWSPREVTCEQNYMEVSVRRLNACPRRTQKEDWDVAIKTAYKSDTEDWQGMFREQEMIPMNLSEARDHRYVFDLTPGRLVFRTPYGQPDAISTMVNGVPMQVVHATLFSRPSWVVILVDLLAACSMDDGSYDEHGYLTWETPEMPHPLVSGLYSTEVNIGVNGELVDLPVAEDRGYIVEKHNKTFRISIPYNSEGSYRKSVVDEELYEYYSFQLYLEQLSVDGFHLDSRIRLHRELDTPLMLRPVFTENQTDPEEHVFTVYLGDVPEDVELVAVQLNEQEFRLPFNKSTCTVSESVHPNNTRGYTLRVPLNDPVVIQQFLKDAGIQHSLDINYTLNVLPENEPYYHFTTVTTLTAVSFPAFDAVCSESGITFKLDYQPFDYMWYFSIGPDPLTSDLACEHGYILTNDSQSLQLYVPLSALGYEYKNISLNGFSATFEILVRDQETSEVHGSTVKTCHFSPTEVIVCSADGRITAVADLSLVIPTGGTAARTNLRDQLCVPKETNGTRALFSFPLNSCGSKVKLWNEYVIYENEVFHNQNARPVGNHAVSTAVDSVTLQCMYPLAGLHRLFSVYRFESDTPGKGLILGSANKTKGLESPSEQPTTVQPPVATTELTMRAGSAIRLPLRATLVKQAYHPPVRQIRVFPSQRLSKQGVQGSVRRVYPAA